MKYKKPNLSTVESALATSDTATFGAARITLTKSGFFRVEKFGEARTYSTINDAWRAI
jgi:hypothetical protein